MLRILFYSILIILLTITHFLFRMRPIQKRINENQGIQKKYVCRLCNNKHGLRNCKIFIDKEVEDRLRLVILHRYCPNCLAHNHSAGSCFSKKGCKHCGGNHHSLLHIRSLNEGKQSRRPKSGNNRNIHGQAASRSSLSTCRSVSIASLTSPNTTNLFPTAVVLLKIGQKKHHVRAVIDPCTSVSKISLKLVRELKLPTTTLGDDSICTVKICSRQSSTISLETTMTVNNRISINTPIKSIDGAIANKFENMILADPQFFKSNPFALVLGADVYGKIIRPGLLPSLSGLPVATNTIFGWVLSGSCSN